MVAVAEDLTALDMRIADDVGDRRVGRGPIGRVLSGALDPVGLGAAAEEPAQFIGDLVLSP